MAKVAVAPLAVPLGFVVQLRVCFLSRQWLCKDSEVLRVLV